MAGRILDTGATVKVWNIGNEANYGFAGVSVGLKTAVNPALAKVPSWMTYMLPIFATDWLANNVRKYNAKQMQAVADGIRDAYADRGRSSRGLQFSTHIASVVSTVSGAVKYYRTLQKNGFDVSVAGISFYPSAPALYLNKITMFKKMVERINQETGLRVFVAEYSYPSGKASGPYAGWSQTVKGYPHTEKGQATLYHDLVTWGKSHGLAGIRYWAPDYRGWGTMSMFDYGKYGATAKKILTDQIR